MAKQISVTCVSCGESFFKSVRRYNEAIKNRWLFYCSRKCYKKHKTIKKDLKCEDCGKDIKVGNSVFNESKNKKFFCSSSCSASYSNARRAPMSEETKRRIKESVLITNRGVNYRDNYEKVCFVCNNIFVPIRDSHIFCSRMCSKVYQFGCENFTKEDIIKAILEKSKELDHTPNQRTCRKFHSTAKTLFGSWNKAVKACGLKPNSNLYKHIRSKSVDGHMCDSISEKIVDNWLFSHGLIHEKNKRYPDSRKNCDFYVTDKDLWIEYFGLLGDDDDYDHVVTLKREMVGKFKLKFVEITIEHLVCVE